MAAKRVAPDSGFGSSGRGSGESSDRAVSDNPDDDVAIVDGCVRVNLYEHNADDVMGDLLGGKWGDVRLSTSGRLRLELLVRVWIPIRFIWKNVALERGPEVYIPKKGEQQRATPNCSVCVSVGGRMSAAMNVILVEKMTELFFQACGKSSALSIRPPVYMGSEGGSMRVRFGVAPAGVSVMRIDGMELHAGQLVMPCRVNIVGFPGVYLMGGIHGMSVYGEQIQLLMEDVEPPPKALMR